jgi:hypothetical protein
MNTKLTPQQEREIAVQARCDPRTVRAFFAGRAQSAMTRASIEAAIRQCGFGAVKKTDGGIAPEADFQRAFAEVLREDDAVLRALADYDTGRVTRRASSSAQISQGGKSKRAR